MVLSHLKHIEFQHFDDGISASELVALLAVAPQLQVMSGVYRHGMLEKPNVAGNWLRLEPCTRDAMLAMHRLQWRLKTGLVFHNMRVRCVTSMESKGLVVPSVLVRPRVDLCKLKPLSFFNFIHYILRDGLQASCEALAPSLGLALWEIQFMLTHLTHLTLEEVWCTADLEVLMEHRYLKNIFVVGLRGVNKEDVVQLVGRMPWLQQLCHNARIYTTSYELRDLLRAGHGGASLSGGDPSMCVKGAADWVVCHLSRHTVQEMWFTQAALRRTAVKKDAV